MGSGVPSSCPSSTAGGLSFMLCPQNSLCPAARDHIRVQCEMGWEAEDKQMGEPSSRGEPHSADRKFR